MLTCVDKARGNTSCSGGLSGALELADIANKCCKASPQSTLCKRFCLAVLEIGCLSAGGPYEGGVLYFSRSAGFLCAVFDGQQLNLT